jgi:hypothetical protein
MGWGISQVVEPRTASERTNIHPLPPKKALSTRYYNLKDIIDILAVKKK